MFLYLQLLLTNLTADTVYTLELRSASRSLYNAETIYKSPSSQPLSIRLGRSCDHVQPFTVLKIESVEQQQQEEKMPSIDGAAVSTNEGAAAGSKTAIVDLGTGVIAGIALVVMILMVVAVGIVLRR